MKKMRLVVVMCCLLAAGAIMPAHADDYRAVRSTTILTSSVASNGQKLSYLRTDNPEVTAKIVEIDPGGETGWHTHPVPVYAYMLSGTITVTLADGRTYDYKEGDAIFEVRDIPHNGRNNGTTPARLVVFYTGAAGTPNVKRVDAPVGGTGGAR